MKTEKISRVKAHQRYYVDDVQVPGVTTVTGMLNKPALVRWANKMGLEGIDTSVYVSKIADAGTLAHMMVQSHWCSKSVSQEELDSFTAEQRSLAENAFLSYLEWEKYHTIEPLLDDAGNPRIEWQLTSRQHGYGGTLDLACVVDGKKAVVDIKTSKDLYWEHFCQVSAYWHLARENGWDAELIQILRIGRTEDEGFDDPVVRMPKLGLYFEAFLSLLEARRKCQRAGWR